MEISNSLRSLDAVTGRSIGTDRPPSPAPFVVPTHDRARAAEPETSPKSELDGPGDETRADGSRGFEPHAASDPTEREPSASEAPVTAAPTTIDADPNAGPIQPAFTTVVPTSLPGTTNMVAKLPAVPSAIPATRAASGELGSILAALPSDVQRAAAGTPSEDTTAPLESIAIAEGEWIDEIEFTSTEATTDRREARAPEPTADRLAPTRATHESPATEHAREAAHAPRAQETDRAAEILKQIRLRLSPELRQATIHLAPPELGRLSIQLTLEDRRLFAAVRIEKRETLEVLGRHLPELRAALASHGIEAEQFEFALGFQNDPNTHSDARDGERSRSAEPVSRPEAHSVREETLMRALASASGVDLYA